MSGISLIGTTDESSDLTFLASQTGKLSQGLNSGFTNSSPANTLRTKPSESASTRSCRNLQTGLFFSAEGNNGSKLIQTLSKLWLLLPCLCYTPLTIISTGVSINAGHVYTDISVNYRTAAILSGAGLH